MKKKQSNKKIKKSKSIKNTPKEVVEKKESVSFFKRIKAQFNNFLTNPLNAILFKFSVLMGLFYLVWATPFFQENFVKYVALTYANVTGFFLQLVKVPVTVMGDAIGDMNFAVSIKNGCDGIEAMAILLFAILVYPTSWANRLKGFVTGLACLVALNFVRIISLYFIGVHLPSLFEVMHVSIWQVIFILVPLIIIYQWVNWIKTHQVAID